MADITLTNESSFEDLRAALKADAEPPKVEEAKEPEAAKTDDAQPPAQTDDTASSETKETKTEDLKTEEEPKTTEEKKPKRFSELTRMKREAEAAALAEKQRADALAKELEDLRAGKKPEPKAEEGKPQPPNPDTFTGTWQELEAARAKYAEDLAEWKTNQAIKKLKDEQAAEEAKKAAAERNKGWQTQVDKLLDEHQEVMQEALTSVGSVAQKLGIIEVIKESEVGAEIVLALHQDKATLDKLANMSPYSAAREIGRIEDRILAKKAPTSAAKAPLPKPPQALGGSTGGGSTRAVEVEKLGMAELKSFVRNELKR